MRLVTRLLASTLLTFFLFTTLAFAQGAQTGGITGVVKDSTGAVVANANVEIYREETGRLERSLTAGQDGNFMVTLLPPGNYRLQVSASGFKQYRATRVPVRINETTRHDAELAIGIVEEIVQVEATPTLINTVNATTGQPIDSRTLSALPLPMPNFLFLLTLSSGAGGEPPDVRAANRGMVNINVNGQRTSNNSVSVEGINVNDFNLAQFDTIPLPNPNVIQEFKVATSLYDATLGSKGGGAVSLVMKSGTKDFHGQAYWSHRNDALNANEWFRNATASNRPAGEEKASRARLLQNVFGGSASGPFPFVGGFWFANYQGVRARNGLDPNGSSLRPTIQAFPRNADGTTSAALLAQAFNLNAADIDPVAINILNLKRDIYGSQFLIPRPGDPGCLNPSGPTATFTCTISGIAPLTDNQYTISYDRTFHEGKDKILGRWFWDNGDVSKPYGTNAGASSTLAFPRADVQKNRFFTFSHTRIISPRMVNEFRLGFSRFISAFAPTDSVNLSDIGATRPNSGEIPGMYFINLVGLFTLGTGVNDDRGTVSNQFQFHDTWSLTTSRHTLRAGGEVSRYQLNRFNRFAVRGSLTFGTIAGTPIDSSFKSFLSGRATTVQNGAGDPQRYFRATDVAAFFQDDWRIHPRLTLNLGLRWEGLGVSSELLNRIGIYDPSLLYGSPNANPFIFPEATNIEGFKGTPGVSRCSLNSCFDSNNFAPRISFGWDVFGNQKTVVRGGYGIYYQRLSNQNILQLSSNSPPFNIQGLENRPSGDPVKVLANPFPTAPPSSLIAQNLIPQASRFAGVQGDINTAAGLPIFINDRGERCILFSGTPGTALNCSITLATFAAPPLDFGSPYTQQWNLMVQRELLRGVAVEVGYVGSHYAGGLGIWNPYQARLASPENPIRVTDINGVTHTITVNTPNNEPLRHELLGLSGRLGARFTAGVGHATYHSGQITVSRRFQNGLFFQGAYTFSKAIDNVSGSMSTDELNFTRAGQGGSNLINFGTKFPRLNRARGDFDRPHRFVFSYIWEIPTPKQGFLSSKVFQGWSVSGIVSYQSGLPFSIGATGGGAFGGQGLSTPTAICASASEQIASLPTCTPGTVTDPRQAITGGRIQDRLSHYLNPNLFINPGIIPNGVTGATDFGNVPRNLYRGPFQQNWDFSIGKKINVAERHAINIRAEFFNLWNHPVFRGPAILGLANRSSFAQITETAIPARLIQFALKYDF